jgi:hypothetical protein
VMLPRRFPAKELTVRVAFAVNTTWQQQQPQQLCTISIKEDKKLAVCVTSCQLRHSLTAHSPTATAHLRSCLAGVKPLM